MSEIEILPIPAGLDEVAVTLDEIATFAAMHGTCMTVTRDGQLYRIIQPWETGPEPPQ